jgi:hypothetical protein
VVEVIIEEISVAAHPLFESLENTIADVTTFDKAVTIKCTVGRLFIVNNYLCQKCETYSDRIAFGVSKTVLAFGALIMASTSI